MTELRCRKNTHAGDDENHSHLCTTFQPALHELQSFYMDSFIQLPMRSTTKSHYRLTTDPGASRPLWVSAVTDAVKNIPLCLH